MKRLTNGLEFKIAAMRVGKFLSVELNLYPSDALVVISSVRDAIVMASFDENASLEGE